MDHQLSLTRKMQLVDAVQEIAMNENSTDWLSSEYVEILNDQETIRKEFKNRDKSLEYLSGIITDLYVDWNKLQGVDVKNRIPALQKLILAGNSAELVKAFMSPAAGR